MNAAVVRVVMEIAAFFAIAAAGIWGFPLAGFGMAALAAALLVPAMDARDFAENLHLFRCSDACRDGGGGQFTRDVWQWNALWIAAVVGIITLWASVALGIAAGALGVVPRTRRACYTPGALRSSGPDGDCSDVVRRADDLARSVRRSLRHLIAARGT